MLKKGTKFVWSEDAEAAFLDIKSRLTSRPILRPPDFSRPFCIALCRVYTSATSCAQLVAWSNMLRATRNLFRATSNLLRATWCLLPATSCVLRATCWTSCAGVNAALDASDVAIGACLFQVIDGMEHPVAFYSKKLNNHQKNYSVVEKEALALILATFSVYLDSKTVYSDQSPLQFFA